MRKIKHLCEKATEEILRSLFPTQLTTQVYIKEPIIVNNKKIKSFLIVDFVIKLRNKLIFVEFNGQQHYKAVSRFGGKAELEKTRIRDKWLANYCKEKNIILITVDGRTNHVPASIRETILQALSEHQIKLPKNT